MEDLLFEYKRTLKQTRKLYKQLGEAEESELSAEKLKDKKIIRSIITDLEYVTEWLEKGRQPGIRRAIDRRDAYQRLLIKDPRIIESFSSAIDFVPDGQVSDEDRRRIKEALSLLTEREKEMFLLHKVECFSYERIAALLGVKKSTVQTTIKRALLKIHKQKEERKLSLA
ncbi:sigma-70 family RNA polymerase sigma factor [Bacillus atrophaeus]|uniref:Positive control sigma-like factor n=1 Tax=Bacillus atrophaeus (strain 1942) TaxID=720555 RepID=A0ABN3Z6V9_BACA1|nr:sigma-70 family RNA polymerase sigma factor [Bacillus atrophaeus]AMR63328.1 Fis family transcriptional regulator [Bacillus subtilis subsp. globigii]ADP31740.1 positive control sigma-like factor [Bacillus atrophaeus 1942]AIK47550.1 RNA polymerase sigma factor, sigma-70 family protein [Bacillus atrophaeus subsp. globigii]EIM10552.1 positive control sigma-like factor [Bacillus atrophaeus C89]KFK82947.1 RNA polymerase sigma factor, sigma-70 family protein [Bacillus atrophaeus]